MNATRLTPTERRTLRVIERFTEAKGFPPTYRELARELGVVSSSTSCFAVDGLVNKGYVERTDNVARGLRVVASSGEHSGRMMTDRERQLNKQVRLYGSPEHLTVAEMDADGEFTAVTITKVRI